MPFRLSTSCTSSSFSLVETEVFLLVLLIDTESRYSKERVIRLWEITRIGKSAEEGFEALS